MTKTIQGGNFTSPAGAALNGNLLLVLSQDAKVAAQSGLVVPTSVRVPISSGSVTTPTLIYFNDELLPNNTTYTMTAYDATGNKVYGPEIVSLTGAGPLDLGTLVPLLISPDPLFSNPVLQNPTLAQTITGQGLTLSASAPLTIQGTATIGAGAAIASSGAGGTMTAVIASGTAALGTGAIAATSAAAAITVAATGVLSTDSILWSFNTAPPSGYAGVSPAAGLVVLAYVTNGNVNFQVCNPTAASITPAAATLNWRVVR